jgi:hypothetical protein
MARRKKPENETTEDAEIRRIMETIAGAATRNEKVSWNRKLDNMEGLINKLRPLEDEITDLMAKKVPIMDQVSELRQDMVHDCIHPYTSLVFKDDYVECKFCYKKFVVNEIE